MNATRTAGSSRRKRLAAAALVVAAVALALGLAEGSIRLWVLVRHDNNRDVYNLWNAVYQADPHSWYRPRPSGEFRVFGGLYRVETDSRGFRSPEPLEIKPSNGYRVAFLGGSTTFNSEAPTNDHTIALQTLKMLAESRPDLQFEVMNAAVPGYTTMESLTTLVSRILPLDPDLVVVYHGINDAVFRVLGEYRDDYRREPKPVRTRFDSRLYRWSLLYRFVNYKAIAGSASRRPPPDQLRENLSNNTPEGFERNLRSMLAVARAHGIRVVLCSFAYCPDTDLPDREEWAIVFQAVDEQNAVIRQVAQESGTLFLDVAALFPRQCDLFTSQVHRNAEGLRAHARLLTDFILDEEVLPSKQ